jgi:hypothetical protein
MIQDFSTVLVWAAIWTAGGWLLAMTLFRLRRAEAGAIGFGLGLVLQVWLANLLAHLITPIMAFWAAALLVAAAGVGSAIRFPARVRPRPSVTTWLTLAALSVLFGAIGRGLGLFDDYQNLPTVSIMAAGDIPPHFALNPSFRFGYHYALLLFSAELMRLGRLLPWTALDMARGVSLALPLVLAGFWAFRMSRSRVAALLTAGLLAFSGGTRWMLLLAPPSLVDRISNSISMIGSAAQTAPSLSQAMVSAWKIDGAGPLLFPFAFYSGVNQPYIMAYTGIAGSGILILLLLLLTANRWQHWSAGLITTVLLATLAIANEIAFLLLGLGFLISAAGCLIGAPARMRRRNWLIGTAVLGAASIIAAVQGGMLTEIVGSLVSHNGAAASYFDATPVLSSPASIVSAHLGALSLLNPWQLLAGLLEIGPIVLVSPLLVAWGLKSLRLQNWFEVSLLAGSIGAIISLFVTFHGPLFTATPRLMSTWFVVCALYAVPLLWIVLRRREERLKAAALLWGVSATLGGVVLFGVQLAAIQKPIYATFITPMDAKMSQDYWNSLPSTAWIFDPVVFRSPTIFGRFTHSSPTWYTRLQSWEDLRADPTPTRLRAAGFQYAYFDRDYWDGLGTIVQADFSAACVKQVAQVDGIHGENDYTRDFRRLLDIRACH